MRMVFFSLCLIVSAQALGASLVAQLEVFEAGEYRLTVLDRTGLDVGSYLLPFGDRAFLYSEQSERLECRDETFNVIRVHGFQGEADNYDRREHFLIFGVEGELRTYLTIPESVVDESGFLTEGGEVRSEICPEIDSSSEYELPRPEQESADAPGVADLLRIEGHEYLLYFSGLSSPKILVQADGGAELRLMDSRGFQCGGRQLVAVPVMFNLPAQGGTKFYRYFIFHDKGEALQVKGMLMATDKVECAEICARIDTLDPVETL
ncbi:hypothetical protein ACFOZ5_10515 [Marinobacter lacisalsi]|uniref:Uncharacterized protein n=1 Tax=Marinobacter lacisalsi TaxID=475979 RepID=A0ABV8QGE9_9GAMM